MNPNSAPWQQPHTQAPAAQTLSTPWAPAPPAGAAPAYNAFGGSNGFTNAQTPQLVNGDGPAISFNPATQTEGGMIDNVWVRFSNGRAGVFDYKGKSSNGPAPAVLYDLMIVDGQTQQPLPGVVGQEKAWTVGKLDDFQPKKNGTQFWSPTGKLGFNKNSNWATFTRAAVAAGIPATVFDSGQVDSLNGLVGFVSIIKQDRGVGSGDGGDKGTLVVTQLPGGGRVAVAAHHTPQVPTVQAPTSLPQFAPPQSMAPAPAPVQGVNRDVAAKLLAEILATNPMSRQAFNVALFQRAMLDAPLRDLVSSAQFQTEMMGGPLTLP